MAGRPTMGHFPRETMAQPHRAVFDQPALRYAYAIIILIIVIFIFTVIIYYNVRKLLQTDRIVLDLCNYTIDQIIEAVFILISL